MSANTIAENKRRATFDGHDSVWLFGYGSLIFKADFPFLETKPAQISGWTRRFWQGSHDHRGTQDAPGRVATLVPEQGALCDGLAYHISPDVFDHLDYREKNGYLRFTTELTFRDQTSAQGLVYIATEDNTAFLGPAPEGEIAAYIQHKEGPSGRNADYLKDLAAALRGLNAHDDHVFEIEQHLLILEGKHSL